MTGLNKISYEDDNLLFTTLTKGNRLSDRYMKVWENAGEIVSRNINELKNKFDKSGSPFAYYMDGDMAFINC